MTRTDTQHTKGGNGTPTIQQKMQIYNQLLNRMMLARNMGQQFKGKRDVYGSLGYPTNQELTFSYFYDKYSRQDMASAIIDRPVDAAWDGPLTISSPDYEGSDTDQMTEAWNKLMNNFKLKHEFARLDRLCGIGRFALLLFGFNDISRQQDFQKPVAGGDKALKFLRPFPEGDVEVEEWDQNPASPRYGWPKVYALKTGTPGNAVTRRTGDRVLVHYTRVLHVSEGSVFSDVYGESRLKPVINRLIDIEKLLGGDAEMFWKGARPGYFAKTNPDAEWTSDEEEALKDQMENFEHDLLRFLTAEGVEDIKSLEQQIADPSSHLDVQIQAISAKTGIPKRILVGSERGEQASTQDITQWRSVIQSKREWFCEPKIVRPFVDKCIKHGVLPEVSEYTVEQNDLFAPSEKEQAEVGKVKAETLKAYTANPVAQDIFPPELFREMMLMLNDEQLERVQQFIEEQQREEEQEGQEFEQQEQEEQE